MAWPAAADDKRFGYQKAVQQQNCGENSSGLVVAAALLGAITRPAARQSTGCADWHVAALLDSSTAAGRVMKTAVER
jgi:hypothetical protein